MNDKELSEVIQRHIAGDITPEQHQALQTELKSSSTARAAFREAMDVEASLRTWAAELGSPAADDRLAAPAKRRSPAASVWLALTAMAASLALFSLTWWIWPTEPNQSQVVEQRRQPAITRVAYVGAFGKQQDCVWNTDKAIPGSRFSAQKLSLASGVAELNLDSGTNMIVEGPCDLEIVQADAARLLAGNVVIHVTELSDGFTLTTPEATIIDEGTEYAVSLNDEATEVHVYEGRVIWEPKDADGASQAERIESGEARRYSRSNPFHGARIPIGDRMFVRQLEATVRESGGDALLAYDGFENLAGRIQRGRSGFGWSDGWKSGRRGPGGQGEIVEAPGDALFGSERTDRRQLRLSEGEAIVRNFEQPLSLEIGDVYFVSFLLKRTLTDDAQEQASGRFFELSLINDGARRGRGSRRWFTFGITSESLPFIKSVGSITSTASPVEDEAVHFCVAKILVTEDQVKTFFRIHREGESLESQEPTVWTTSGETNPGNFNLSGIRLSVGATAQYDIDELKIGTTWESVVAATHDSR